MIYSVDQVLVHSLEVDRVLLVRDRQVENGKDLLVSLGLDQVVFRNKEINLVYVIYIFLEDKELLDVIIKVREIKEGNKDYEKNHYVSTGEVYHPPKVRVQNTKVLIDFFEDYHYSTRHSAFVVVILDVLSYHEGIVTVRFDHFLIED